jgi:UPF0716 protein FxsA
MNPNPFRVLFALFIVIPIVEVYLLIQVGSWIGVIPTVLLVIATAMMGISLLRSQGLSTLMSAQQSLARGEVPAFQLMEGAALLVSGALLLTPGFVTDLVGFLGLAPLTRKMMVSAFLSRVTLSGIRVGQHGSFQQGDGPDVARGAFRNGAVVDGEVVEEPFEPVEHREIR